MIILWLLWLAMSIVSAILYTPKIKAAILDSGVIELAKEQKKKQGTSESRPVDVCFVNSKGVYILYQQKQRRLGGDIYHDTMENLLYGPSEENIKNGATTYIDQETTLIGCSVSCNTLFVDFSKDFLNSKEIEKAYAQVVKTATDFPRIDTMTLLIEGKEFIL